MVKGMKKVKITIKDKVVKEYVKHMISKYQNSYSSDEEAYKKVCDDLGVLYNADYITSAEYHILTEIFLWEII